MIQIEKAAEKDIAAVKQIELECGLSPWSESDYQEEIARPDSLFYIAKKVSEENKSIGFILARLIMNQQFTSPESKEIEDISGNQNFGGEIEIYNIGIKKKYRGNSIGTALLNEIILSGRKRKMEKIYLDVRKSNWEAIRFYKRHYFKVVGERIKFYKNPCEDALLMVFSFFDAESL